MFHTVLIANRGEIAVRIIRTLSRMGIRSVAVYSEADRDSAHGRLADEAVAIGKAAPSESYLCGDRIIEAALRTGAQAIIPGYGFLSENADFAEACEAAGLSFVGPTAQQMRDFGLKHAARELAHGSPFVIAAEPTRGVDVGAMEIIHGELLRRRDEGSGILLVSSELTEILKLSDRIIVLFEGRIAGELKAEDATEEEISKLMAGVKADAEADIAAHRG